MDDLTDQRAASASERPKESVGEIVRTVIYALLIALVFRTFVFQPFYIPSGSMKSTLLIGDYLFISKYSYGYSKYSLPYGGIAPDSIFSGRIFYAEPERGDVIVFRSGKNGAGDTQNQVDYIKRLVGLPGDRVRMINGVLNINGAPVELRRIGDFIDDESIRGRDGPVNCREMAEPPSRCVHEQYIETLPNGVEHAVLNRIRNGPHDNTREFVVPEGHFFFVGDNRDNSNDSRAGRNGVGFVPMQNVLGRAELIFLSYGGEFWEFWNWRSDRFFKSIE